MNSDTTISHPIAKAVSLWALVGISSWTEAAAFAGFVYSMLLITEWVWKKVLRGIARRRGWLTSPPTDTEVGKL